ncbi:MAG: cyclic nucleotide-binding domain-containing protein [Clostridia bacterium]|nr:cyclic nucleotide-binding domain-containing protein [Clostridia bacterium]
MNTLTFKKGDVIFRQNEFADSMFKIQSGAVRIVSDYEKESEKEITVLESGSFFGEMGLVECYPRSATAIVSSETAEVIEFDSSDFERILKDDPDTVLNLLRQFSQRLQDTNQAYLEAFESVRKEKANQSDAKSKSVLQRLHDYYRSIMGR